MACYWLVQPYGLVVIKYLRPNNKSLIQCQLCRDNTKVKSRYLLGHSFFYIDPPKTAYHKMCLHFQYLSIVYEYWEMSLQDCDMWNDSRG